MISGQESNHAILILRDNRVIYASNAVAEMCACSLTEITDLDHLMRLFSPSNAKRIERLINRVETNNLPEVEIDLCLQRPGGGCIWIDLVISRMVYQDQPAIQMIWIKSDRQASTEKELQRNIWNLKLVHEFDSAILNIQGHEELAEIALRNLAELIPEFRSGSVYLLEPRSRSFELTASRSFVNGDTKSDKTIPWSEFVSSMDSLLEGQPFIVKDVDPRYDQDDLSSIVLKKEAHSGLIFALRWDGELQGLIALYSSSSIAFSIERIRLAQEIVNLFENASQQIRLKKAERQRYREAEAMRDVMYSLAGAADLNQTLEAILVNLHNVIHYDRASLYLVDENDHYVVGDEAVIEQKSSGRTFQENNPLVERMRQTRKPIIISDIQGDTRFTGWPEVETVRAWLGAPLHVGEEMIGFLSLGSLQADSFSQDNAERLQVFADQVAVMLERAWLSEQNQRRTEELEVLSSVTLALDQVEGGENTLNAILQEIAMFSGAQNSVFLFPDRLESTLVVKASLDESTLDFSFPSRWEPLWDVYVRGETRVIHDLSSLLTEDDRADYQRIFPNAQSAVLVPVKTGGNAFGVLGFGFDSLNKVTENSVHMCNAVAEIAAASLRRAVILESLEKQVDVRTQHLSTLYDINTIASEPLALQEVLEQVMHITLESMAAGVGLIHFLNEKRDAFHLEIQKGLPPELGIGLQNISTKSGFWSRLSNSTSPIVINDTAGENNLPQEFSVLYDQGQRAFIGAPIRAKGNVLGLLSLFDRSILDYTIEDITLFMTIADQIGSLVERARLMKQAEIAAVVQERQRLARELHDSVTQLLYSQVLFSGAGLKVLQQGDIDTTRDHLERINQAALQALKEMRLLVYQLRPSDYLEEGLVGALTRRLDAVEKRTGINARLVVEGELGIDEAVEMSLYRIAEEALNNTLKHAQASTVTITLRAFDSRVILEIADNGIGFDPQDSELRGLREAGMGLKNMQERTALMGGKIEIYSKPGKGTRVTVEIEFQP